MNLIDYARNELKIAGLFDTDSDYAGHLAEAVMELIETLSKQSHSGTSGAMTSEMFNKLIKRSPLTPLKGTPDEWEKMPDGKYQNKRDPNITALTNDGNNAYSLILTSLVTKNGEEIPCEYSVCSITFPYLPVGEYIYEGTPKAEPYKHILEKKEDTSSFQSLSKEELNIIFE